jgi:hypothetical protein
MPPVINALVGALEIVVGVVFGIVPLIFMGASLILGSVSKLFTKGATSSSLTSQIASRTITSRQAVE